jgi:hypothetical protein
MLAIVHLLGTFVANLFKSRRRLEVENLFLRHQLNIALRRAPQRLRLRGRGSARRAVVVSLRPSPVCVFAVALTIVPLRFGVAVLTSATGAPVLS